LKVGKGSWNESQETSSRLFPFVHDSMFYCMDKKKAFCPLPKDSEWPCALPNVFTLFAQFYFIELCCCAFLLWSTLLCMEFFVRSVWWVRKRNDYLSNFSWL
jgi:hypothetical protein